MKLNNQVAVITGGGSGIGQAITYLFATEGAIVIIADKNLAAAQMTAQQIGDQAHALEVDVTQNESVSQMAEHIQREFGRVDILVNNAATSRGNDILEIDEETWDFNLDLVLKSVFFCSKALLPMMIEQKKGAIVNISSINGIGTHGMEPYSAAKAGVLNLTRNMATKYGHLNVRVNAISPGTVKTPFWDPLLAENPSILDDIAEWIPLERVGQPEDIAKAVLFLASDDAIWITGSNLVVDGGMTASR
ncbi:MAG: glucose 1-dehydrogenase [Chloroflexota bacterium]